MYQWWLLKRMVAEIITDSVPETDAQFEVHSYILDLVTI